MHRKLTLRPERTTMVSVRTSPVHVVVCDAGQPEQRTCRSESLSADGASELQMPSVSEY